MISLEMNKTTYCWLLLLGWLTVNLDQQGNIFCDEQTYCWLLRWLLLLLLEMREKEKERKFFTPDCKVSTP